MPVIGKGGQGVRTCTKGYAVMDHYICLNRYCRGGGIRGRPVCLACVSALCLISVSLLAPCCLPLTCWQGAGPWPPASRPPLPDWKYGYRQKSSPRCWGFPHSPQSCKKGQGEMYCSKLMRLSNIKTAAVRMFPFHRQESVSAVRLRISHYYHCSGFDATLLYKKA